MMQVRSRKLATHLAEPPFSRCPLPPAREGRLQFVARHGGIFRQLTRRGCSSRQAARGYELLPRPVRPDATADFRAWPAERLSARAWPTLRLPIREPAG